MVSYYAGSIYVRVYEDMIDLLRVAIVGPSGTPYHDGLFFFDVRFPPEYPRCPPYVGTSHLPPLIFPLYHHQCNLLTKTYPICTESVLPFRWASAKSKPV